MRTAKPPPPYGYTEYQNELEMFTNIFSRVVNYNHAVFGDYLKAMITKVEEEELAKTTDLGGGSRSSSETNVSTVVNTASDTVITEDDK